MRTGVMAWNSGLGATEAVEILRSHVNARAIEAVCRLTANSLDLETLIASSLDTASSACANLPFACEARPNEAPLAFRIEHSRDGIAVSLPNRHDNPSLAAFVPCPAMITAM